MFEIGKLTKLNLGRQGENKARVVEIDVSAWLAEFPGASIGILVRRPNEKDFYPVDAKTKDNVTRWTINRSDVAVSGEGEAQIILTNSDDVELRSRVVATQIDKSMSGTETDAPPPQDTFVSKVILAADNAVKAAELAQQGAANAGYMQFEIGDDGRLYMYRTENVDIEFALEDGRIVIYG